jgi:hypothetical protein
MTRGIAVNGKQRTRCPGDFGATIATSTWSGGAMQPKRMLKPCANINMACGDRFGATASR